MESNEKDELINYIVFLDLQYTQHSYSGLNANGLSMLVELQNKYPQFNDVVYRRKTSEKIIGLIRKGK